MMRKAVFIVLVSSSLVHTAMFLMLLRHLNLFIEITKTRET